MKEFLNSFREKIQMELLNESESATREKDPVWRVNMNMFPLKSSLYFEVFVC